MQIIERDMARKDWIGQQFTLHCGCIATITEAKAYNDITITTDTGYVKHHVRHDSLKIGAVGIPKEYWPKRNV